MEVPDNKSETPPLLIFILLQRFLIEMFTCSTRAFKEKAEVSEAQETLCCTRYDSTCSRTAAKIDATSCKTAKLDLSFLDLKHHEANKLLSNQ